MFVLTHRLLYTLVGIDASIAQLDKTWRTHAGERSQGVYTLVFTPVVSGRAFVDVATGPIVRCQDVARGTGASKRQRKKKQLVVIDIHCIVDVL